MRSLSENEAAYLAGLIDGEGTIFVQRVKGGKKVSKCGFHYRAGLAISMTDRRLMKWVHRVTGVGKVSGVRRHKKKHKPGFRWNVWSQQASALLLILYPFLRLKKRHATNLIRFQSRMKFVGSKGHSKTEWTRREHHRQISLKLNKRGQ